jgi:hypothetical protein
MWYKYNFESICMNQNTWDRAIYEDYHPDPDLQHCRQVTFSICNQT